MATTSTTPRPLAIYPMTSLYVGDLHPEVTEAMLYEKFSPVGQILSLRVCRDLRTNKSLGYAYVNFSQVAEAEKVLDTMNFDILKGKPMRIMWSQRDPSLRKSGIGNIFIKNLDKSIDNKAIYDTFSAFGNILSCKVATDDDNISKGYAFVHFDNVDVANSAIEKVNGMLLNGKKVYVGKFIPRHEREKNLGEKGRRFTNVYVKNFGNNLTDLEFYELFATFGKITSWVVMKNPDGSSRGFGFVAYDDAKSAELAIEKMNGYDLNGNALYVGRAQKKHERMEELRRNYELMKLERYQKVQGANIYIKNLDDSFDSERLCKEFSRFGTITSAKVMMENGRSKGFGFVCFMSPEAAQRAIAEMDGRMVENKPLYVSLAQRYEERRAYLSAQCIQRTRHQNLTPTFSAPPFILPSILNGPRFFSNLPQLRAAPRWPAQPVPRLNGTYSLPTLAPPIFRSVSRPSIQLNNARNPRPIVGQVGNNRPNNPNNDTNAHNHNNNNSNNNKCAATSSVLRPGLVGPRFEDKQAIGEYLYNIIEKHYPEKAGKITGMLLEIELNELKNLIGNRELFRSKIEEAVAVLQAHQNNNLIIKD